MKNMAGSPGRLKKWKEPRDEWELHDFHKSDRYLEPSPLELWVGYLQMKSNTPGAVTVTMSGMRWKPGDIFDDNHPNLYHGMIFQSRDWKIRSA